MSVRVPFSNADIQKGIWFLGTEGPDIRTQISRARYRCNFQCKHFPRAVTKPLKLDLRSKSAPIMKQTESIGAFITFFFFFYDWLSGRHKAGWEKACSGVGCQRLWTTSSHHRTTPSTLGSHSTLFFFNPNSLFCRRRKEKSIQGKMWKLLDVRKQRHECGFWQEDGCPVKQTEQNTADLKKKIFLK